MIFRDNKKDNRRNPYELTEKEEEFFAKGYLAHFICGVLYVSIFAGFIENGFPDFTTFLGGYALLGAFHFVLYHLFRAWHHN